LYIAEVIFSSPAKANTFAVHSSFYFTAGSQGTAWCWACLPL